MKPHNLIFLAFALVACAHTSPAVETAAAGTTLSAAAVDRETLAVEVALWERYQGLRARCTDALCDEAAKGQARAALADRLALARALIARQREVADLVEQASRCPDRDAACERSALGAAAAIGATATGLLVQLRQARQVGAP